MKVLDMTSHRNVGVIGERPLKTHIGTTEALVMHLNEDMLMSLLFVIKSSGTASCLGLEHRSVRDILNGRMMVGCA